MKILVSSKGFSKWLKSAIKQDSYVDHVKIIDGVFSIHRDEEKFTICVESKDKNEMVIQYDVRWDWLYRDLKGIQEQPVVIEFLDNVARFTLSF